MTPPTGYVVTAAFSSFSTAALFGYPSAAIHSPHGIAPSGGLWFGIILILGTALTIYSAIPKPVSLLKSNWLVIPSVCMVMLLICWLINPVAINDNFFWLFVFAVFTLGFPFWLPILALGLHAGACDRLQSNKTDR